MEYYQEKVKTEDGIPAKIFFGGSGLDKLHYPLHWHHNLEFDLVLEGCICGKAGSKAVRAEKGQIFFANSGEIHETDGSGVRIMRSITVLLSDELLREYCPDMDSYYFSFEKGSAQEKKLAEKILECAKIYQEKKQYYELELSIILRQMCLILLRECCYEKSASAITGNEHKNIRKVKKAIRYMEEHYENTISVQDMGQVMGMTPTYFSRFFRQSTGETFHSYLTRIRLYRAKRELLESDAGITQISFACGFPNVKSFIEAFKKEYGCTPAKYRKV